MATQYHWRAAPATKRLVFSTPPIATCTVKSLFKSLSALTRDTLLEHVEGRIHWAESKKKPRKHEACGAFRGLCWTATNQFVAEKAGFEPAEGITPRTLSRRVT